MLSYRVLINNIELCLHVFHCVDKSAIAALRERGAREVGDAGLGVGNSVRFLLVVRFAPACNLGSATNVFICASVNELSSSIFITYFSAYKPKISLRNNSPSYCPIVFTTPVAEGPSRTPLHPPFAPSRVAPACPSTS